MVDRGSCRGDSPGGGWVVDRGSWRGDSPGGGWVVDRGSWRGDSPGGGWVVGRGGIGLSRRGILEPTCSEGEKKLIFSSCLVKNTQLFS